MLPQRRWMKIGAPGSNTLGNVREQRLKNDYFLIKKEKKELRTILCTFISLSNPILCEIGWLKQYQPDVDLFRTRFRAKGREGESKRNAKRWSADDLQGAQRPKHTSAMATVACVYITPKYTQVQPANASSFFLHFKHSTREIIK